MKTRRGVALIAALMLLSLLALMTAGAFAAAVAVRRGGRFAQAEAGVMTDVDGAISDILSNWFGLAFSELPVGDTDMQVVGGANAVSLDSVFVTRLPGGVYWVVAAASAASPEHAYRRVNLLLRVPGLRLVPSAAFTSAGNVGIGPGMTFDQDTTREQGSSCGQSPIGVGLAPGAILLAEAGGSTGSIVTATQPAAGDTTTYQLLPQGWTNLAGRANVRYQAGDHVALVPERIIYGEGDLVVDGGSGQGLLLVEGHLTIDGPTVFQGLIVARGGITISASTEVTGAVMSAAAGNGAVSLQSAAIHYSSCAVAAAVAAASVPRPVSGRSWVEMF